uniref:Uncharacterized protein n=1 Tax=Solanum lycopersicum TaxID=4081 RepID=A0A3Q7H750_SOLLC
METHTFLGLLAKIKGKVHHDSLLSGPSSVVLVLHCCLGLAHPTNSTSKKPLISQHYIILG